MTGMEHAIERAAKEITDRYPSFDPISANGIARALADAGLISPYPLVKEWGTIDRAVDRHMWSNIAWHAKTEEHARDAAWSFGYDVLHRYRTEWMDDDE